jgi:hypothetical protein
VAGGRAVRLIGVDRSGSEYACSAADGQGGSGFGIFQGPVDDRSIGAMLTWRINAVAVPLNEACWLGGYGGLKPGYSGASYQRAVEDYVNRLNANGIYVIIRLAGAAPGDNAFLAPGIGTSSTEIPMADADHALAFWTSVAQALRDNHKVLFHAYDEPNGDQVSWDCVLNGCSPTDAPGGVTRYGAYRAVGHQAIVNAIRGAGATQPIILSGISFAGDLGQWEQSLPSDPQHQLVAGFNTFDYSANFAPQQQNLIQISHRYPIVIGGFGDTNCTSRFSQSVMSFADQYRISYLAWTWNTVQDYGGCANALLDDPGSQITGQPRGYYTARPSGSGQGIHDHYLLLPGHTRGHRTHH